MCVIPPFPSHTRIIIIRHLEFYWITQQELFFFFFSSITTEVADWGPGTVWFATWFVSAIASPLEFSFWWFLDPFFMGEEAYKRDWDVGFVKIGAEFFLTSSFFASFTTAAPSFSSIICGWCSVIGVVRFPPEFQWIIRITNFFWQLRWLTFNKIYYLVSFFWKFTIWSEWILSTVVNTKMKYSFIHIPFTRQQQQRQKKGTWRRTFQLSL